MANIRKATSEDVTELAKINNYLFYLSKDQFDPTFDSNWQEGEGIKNYLSKIINSEDSILYVVEEDNKLVGYIAGEVTQPDEYRVQFKQADLLVLMILPEYQKRGLARELWKRFIEWCKERRIKNITACVFSKNTNAIKFYKKLGFRDYDLRLEIDL